MCNLRKKFNKMFLDIFDQDSTNATCTKTSKNITLIHTKLTNLPKRPMYGRTVKLGSFECAGHMTVLPIS